MQLITRHVLLVVGWAALGLGVVGIVVPVLPTVPFLLLAAACFVRSSERLHLWLTTHPVFGHHIADFMAGRGLRVRAKVTALLTLWASILLSVVLVVPLLAADVVMVAVAAGVSVYIIRLPTCPPGPPSGGSCRGG